MTTASLIIQLIGASLSPIFTAVALWEFVNDRFDRAAFYICLSTALTISVRL